MADCLRGLLKVAMRRTLVLAVGMAAWPALAQSLPDPTRPPAAFEQERGDAEAARSTGPVLESVLIPKVGRPLAVISGQQVRVGEKYGDSRLIGLSENEAVLRGPSGTERLMLTPGIEKTSSITKNRTKASSSSSARGRSKP